MTTKTATPQLTAALPGRQRMSSACWREAIEGVLYTLPWIVGFLVFILGPLAASFYLSFTKYNVLRPPQFIGIDNFIYMFTNDPLFIPSILRTFYFALLSVPIAMVLSLFVAILLNQKLVGPRSGALSTSCPP